MVDMHNKKRGCIYLVFICFLSLPIPAFAWSGKVVGIADGDSITVLRKKEGFMGYLQTPVEIRLYGIDCPEKGQSLGRKAKQFTSEMVYRKSVEVTEVTTDRYGLTVAIVLEDNLNLNEELVRAGLAWVYTRYCDWPICDTWQRLEADAREGKRGLWADPDPTPPWEYRRQGKK